MTERNWARTHTFTGPIRRPGSVEELAALVAGAHRLRALGARHSFTDLADGEALVDLADLPARFEVAADRSTVTVAGHLSYGHLARLLAGEDLAVHNTASLPHITVAGAIATATHGSGDGNGNLATAVAGLELLDARGDLVAVGRGDPDFEGMVVSLGALGVVTAVTLDVQPAFEVKQQVFQDLPWDDLADGFDDLFGAGYSVSAFLRFGPAVDQLWVKQLADRPDPDPAVIGGTPAPVDLHPMVELPAGACTPQRGIVGPWADRLPHFRSDAVPASGEEIQSEYFVDRRHAAGAIRALRAVGDRLRPMLKVAEVRTVAGDDLWLSPSTGGPAPPSTSAGSTIGRRQRRAPGRSRRRWPRSTPAPTGGRPTPRTASRRPPATPDSTTSGRCGDGWIPAAPSPTAGWSGRWGPHRVRACPQSASPSPTTSRSAVPQEVMRATVENIFRTQGLGDEDAMQAADTLLYADLRGIDSHGVSNMFPIYMHWFSENVINPRARPSIIREAAAVATVDDDGGLGLATGPRAMDLAIAKAEECGIGAVSVTNGRHYGAAGYHAHRAVPHGMIGVSMTIGGLMVVPTYGSKPMVGLNPIAVAVTGGRHPDFVFDASMSSVAGNKIRIARRLGAEVLPGWISDGDGNPIMVETAVPDDWWMLPTGGVRDGGSHKGYSLAMMVDVLSGILAGDPPGFLRPPGEVSHHFLAYRIDAFCDEAQFTAHMEQFLTALVETPPTGDHDRVVYAGLVAAETEADRRARGIPYHPEVVQYFRTLAGDVGAETDL